MTADQLSPIDVKFEHPTCGYWDNGTRAGGTYTATVHFENDPKRSYVKWGSWELNNWFTFPLHQGGKALLQTTIMRKARQHLAKHISVPVTIR